jgi:hypothetical protein
MGATQAADARFLRRILMGLVMLTLLAGAVVAYSTVGVLSAEGVDLCTTSGLPCSD